MSYKHFSNKDCEFYPCKGKEEIYKGIIDGLNCLFCFCPLYRFGDCGGDFNFTDKGIKDCSECLLPHEKDGYDYIINFLKKKNSQ